MAICRVRALARFVWFLSHCSSIADAICIACFALGFPQPNSGSTMILSSLVKRTRLRLRLWQYIVSTCTHQLIRMSADFVQSLLQRCKSLKIAEMRSRETNQRSLSCSAKCHRCVSGTSEMQCAAYYHVSFCIQGKCNRNLDKGTDTTLKLINSAGPFTFDESYSWGYLEATECWQGCTWRKEGLHPAWWRERGFCSLEWTKRCTDRLRSW